MSQPNTINSFRPEVLEYSPLSEVNPLDTYRGSEKKGKVLDN